MTADMAQVSATMIFLVLLAILMITDALWLRLPVALNVTLCATGLAIGHWAFGVPFVDRAIGAAGGYLVLRAISASYQLMRGRPGMGAGDPVMLCGLGAWLGWQPLPMTVLGASVIGLIVAVLRNHRAGFDQSWDKMHLPFGSLMAVAAIVTVFVTEFAPLPLAAIPVDAGDPIQ
jgi:leader peptidase (prepilin peptidase)/N-methyltransferase